jgi:hypothetical protein
MQRRYSVRLASRFAELSEFLEFGVVLLPPNLAHAVSAQYAPVDQLEVAVLLRDRSSQTLCALHPPLRVCNLGVRLRLRYAAVRYGKGVLVTAAFHTKITYALHVPRIAAQVPAVTGAVNDTVDDRHSEERGARKERE